MKKINLPRGTQDIFADSFIWQQIEKIALKKFSSAGFKEIKTPIFESTDLFKRAVGEDSDIVSKEMYSFNDRSDRSLTLRPEGTAPAVRAFIEMNLGRGVKPQKLWYRGPMFRYERPQTGRYRQFHQIGIEALGSSSSIIDLEVIKIGFDLLEELGIQNLKLHINSIGNIESRKNYRDILKTFLAENLDKVCDDCKRRYETNPLRCLDCKVPADQKIYKNAPVITEHLDEESQKVWDEIKQGLKDLAIDFVEDPNLVRGLDYYNHVVYEIKTTSDKLGTQATVLAGGRYDSLVGNLGGEETPACGWALGMERIASLMPENRFSEEKKVYIISDDAKASQKLAFNLRKDLDDIKVEYDFDSGKFKKQLERALKQAYQYAIIYMEDERKSGRFKLKCLGANEEHDLPDYGAVLEKLS